MADITSRIHWLSFTVHAPTDTAFLLYDILFKDTFGPMECTGHGGRGFQLLYRNALEFKIYTEPTKGQKVFYHYEIPGSACDCIDWQTYFALNDLLKSNFKDKYFYKRLDYAFDYVPFEPLQVREAIDNKELRSLAKRSTLKITESPNVLRENGVLGTCTVSLGSLTSQRMIRVYNKRGFTRLEMQLRDVRADMVAKQMFAVSDTSIWFILAMGYLLDYVDFENDWWKEFKTSHIRAGATVSKPVEVSMTKLLKWQERQVMPSLSVLVDLFPPEVINNFIDRGRRRRGDKYSLLLADAQPTTIFDGEGPREGRGPRQSVGGGL